MPDTCARLPGAVWINCRCETCGPAAARLYKLHRNGFAIVKGRDEAWKRLERWHRAGWSTRVVSGMTGLAISSVRPMFRSIERGDRILLRQATVNAILASDGRPSGTGRIPAIGATRRMQALAAIGWSAASIRARTGIPEKTTQNLRRGFHSDMTADTANRVAAAYDALWSTPGPSKCGATRARQEGWAPPLAWDDDSIDDPSSVPNLGESNHLPNGGGGRPAVEVAEDVEFLLDNDATLTTKGAAHRLGMLPDSLKASLARAGRLDLRDRLTHNAQEAA